MLWVTGERAFESACANLLHGAYTDWERWVPNDGLLYSPGQTGQNLFLINRRSPLVWHGEVLLTHIISCGYEPTRQVRLTYMWPFWPKLLTSTRQPRRKTLRCPWIKVSGFVVGFPGLGPDPTTPIGKRPLPTCSIVQLGIRHKGDSTVFGLWTGSRCASWIWKGISSLFPHLNFLLQTQVISRITLPFVCTHLDPKTENVPFRGIPHRVLRTLHC